MSTWMTGTLAAAALAVGLPYAASGDEQADEAFLQDAISSHLAEIQLSQLAQQKSDSEGVIDFADTLVRDHREALDEARELAQEHEITAPTEPTPEQQMAYERMSQLSGDRFDREWIGHMVQSHQMGVEKYQTHAGMDDDSEIVDYAEQTLPTLEGHLRQARRLEGQELQSRARSER